MPTRDSVNISAKQHTKGKCIDSSVTCANQLDPKEDDGRSSSVVDFACAKNAPSLKHLCPKGSVVVLASVKKILYPPHRQLPIQSNSHQAAVPKATNQSKKPPCTSYATTTEHATAICKRKHRAGVVREEINVTRRRGREAMSNR